MKKLGFLFILALASTSALADKNVTSIANMTIAVAETAAPLSWTAHYTDTLASRKDMKAMEKNTDSVNTSVKIDLEQQIAGLLESSLTKVSDSIN